MTQSLRHITGNILDLAESGLFDVVVQGCNCQNIMGGGLAREIRERYPHIAEVDANTVKGDYNKLGNWTSGTVTQGAGSFTILNAYTQYNISRGTDVFEYTAFQLILEKIVHAFPKSRIALPHIGMGLAGGDPSWIMPMIHEFADRAAKVGSTVTLVDFG